MAHHVFISYASKNKQLADALCHTLEQHRISCWIAPRDVLPGEPYAREIIRGIRDCQIIVLIYTNDSNSSEHVLNEIDKAFNYGKVIIPFIAEDTRMSDEFDYYLSRKHWLTAYPNPEEHFAKLVESIARTLNLETTPVATPTPVRPVLSEGRASTTPPPAAPRPAAAPVIVPRPQAGRIRTRSEKSYGDDRYEGEFYDNKRDGQGTYYYKSGNKYVGDWIDGERTGKGTFYWTDGDRYEGEFVDNKMHGRGTYYYNNGNRYEGDWREDKRTGKGTFYWASGDRYEGDYLDNKMHGRGIYYWKDGDRYEGDFFEGDFHGQGTKYRTDGTRLSGRWEHDKFVG